MIFLVVSRLAHLEYGIAEMVSSLRKGCINENAYTKTILRNFIRGIVPDKILGRRDRSSCVALKILG